ncbi:hypothetical protein ACFLSQ_09610 [Bacteroidota bacterium]
MIANRNEMRNLLFYRQDYLPLKQYVISQPINTPKSRACKIILFQHYHTDAPI